MSEGNNPMADDSKCTKTGGYEKSEDGEFPPTEGSPYIHPHL